jgi:hypothetical protein
MTDLIHHSPTVVRTDRGLTIKGTRLTLYSIMDCVVADWPAEEIRELFNLTDQEMADVMAYIEEHREEVYAEYEQVLREAEEIRAYWEERNRERLAEIATEIAAKPYPPEQAEIRAKLAAEKARLGLT